MDQRREREPLLPLRAGSTCSELGDHHAQFCHLVGVRSLNQPDHEQHKPHPQSLYARALKQRRDSACTYMFTATLVNTLLLAQIVLGAALTGLGASDSSRVLITTFGALNTIIAGVVAFLKSRGQPLRSRMFRDDLSRVVDEIENSAIMWFGISAAAHGYDAIDTDDQVTVRSEVARLTRLYDKAVKTNTMNDPDMYSAGTSDSYNAGLRKLMGAGAAGANAAFAAPTNVIPRSQSPVASSQVTQDESKPPETRGSPAGKASEAASSAADEAAQDWEDHKTGGGPSRASTASISGAEDKGREASSATVSTSAVEAVRQLDPDASPASAAQIPKRKEDMQEARHDSLKTNGL